MPARRKGFHLFAAKKPAAPAEPAKTADAPVEATAVPPAKRSGLFGFKTKPAAAPPAAKAPEPVKAEVVPAEEVQLTATCLPTASKVPKTPAEPEPVTSPRPAEEADTGFFGTIAKASTSSLDYITSAFTPCTTSPVEAAAEPVKVEEPAVVEVPHTASCLPTMAAKPPPAADAAAKPVVATAAA